MTGTPPMQPQIDTPQSAAQPHNTGDGIAKVAFILALCSIIPILGLLTGLAAIVLAIFALGRKTNRTKMAVFGVILGIIFPVIASVAFIYKPVLVSVLVQSMTHDKDQANQAVCQANLKCLAKSINMYEMDHDAYPPDLDTIIRIANIPEDGLRCPSSGHTKGVRDYIYVCPPARFKMNPPQNLIIGCELGGWHNNNCRMILYVDCTVRFSNTDLEFQKELADPVNAEFAAAMKKVQAGGQ